MDPPPTPRMEAAPRPRESLLFPNLCKPQDRNTRVPLSEAKGVQTVEIELVSVLSPNETRRQPFMMRRRGTML